MRDGSGKIIGSFAMKQPGRAEEKLQDDAPDLVEFRAGVKAFKQSLGDDALIEDLKLRIEALEAAKPGKN